MDHLLSRSNKGESRPRPVWGKKLRRSFWIVNCLKQLSTLVINVCYHLFAKYKRNLYPEPVEGSQSFIKPVPRKQPMLPGVFSLGMCVSTTHIQPLQ